MHTLNIELLKFILQLVIVKEAIKLCDISKISLK